MYQRAFLLIILTLSLIRCSSSTNNTTLSNHELTSKSTVIDSTQKAQAIVSKIPSEVDDQFDFFLKYFSQDSLFQISRIDFPLKVQESDWKKDYELSERIINKSDFEKLDFIFDNSNETTELDKYEQTIKVNGNKAVVEIRGIDNGIISDVYFEKKNGKWKLLTWVDSST